MFFSKKFNYSKTAILLLFIFNFINNTKAQAFQGAPVNFSVTIPVYLESITPNIEKITIVNPKDISASINPALFTAADSSNHWQLITISGSEIKNLSKNNDTVQLKWDVTRDFLIGGNPSVVDLRSAMRSGDTKLFIRAMEITGSNFSTFRGLVTLNPIFQRSEEGMRISINLKTIELQPIATQMSAVEIRTQAFKIKGDTTEMDATKFKTNPDATAEDLVSKMPGISSSGGQVQAQGEQVKKVLVDGKPFFGEDPNAALKNLPAEVISKIQVFDGKSDQSQFTGIDDGNTSKTINIITKSQFKNGKFGRFFGGIGNNLGGTGDVTKYKSGLTYNAFKQSRRLTLLYQSNNINEQNFSFEDIVGAMGGGGRGGMRGGMGGMMGGRMMGGGDFFVGNQQGINTTTAFGINYSNFWGPKERWEFSGSYFANFTNNNNESYTFRQYITGQNYGMLYEENNPTVSKNTNHRFNARITWNPDSSNRVLITPRITIQDNNKQTPILSTTRSGEANDLLSNLSNSTNTKNLGINGSIGLNYRHSFAKKGRTIAFNANPSINKQTGNTLMNSINTRYLPIIDIVRFDQNTDNNRLNSSFSSSITFTEALDSNNSIALTYQNNFNENNNDRLTYLQDILTSGLYNVLDTALSSRFVNGYSSHRAGFDHVFQNYKFTITTGIRGQIAQLDGNQQFPFNSPINRTFTSLLPSIQGTYKLGLKKNIRFNYNTSNNAPSIDQLQPVLNNTNPLQLSIGNTSLKQDFNHSLFVRYFSVKPEKNRNFFALVSGSLTNNYLSYKTIFSGRGDNKIALNEGANGPMDSVFLVPGGQLSIPVNINGFYSIRTFISWGRSFNKINFNTNLGATLSSTPSLIQYGNGETLLNTAINPVYTVGLVLSSNLSEKLDFTISSNSSYSQVSNSLQAGLDQTYINQSSRLSFNYMPTKQLVINTDVTHQLYTGFSNGFNQQFLLWNAGLGYKFLKKNAGELRLSTYDILNQNRAIQRNVTQTYFEDVRTTVLTRFIMLTFTYKLSQFGGNKPGQTPGNPTGFPMPPGGMPFNPHGMPGR